jgi:hypothetical protein
LHHDRINYTVIEALKTYFRNINRYYIRGYNQVNDKRDKLIRELQKTPELKKDFIQLKRDYHNEKLSEFVENTNETVRIIEYQGELIQKIDPIYLDSEKKLVKAHFYAPRKRLFGYKSTFWVNTAVIWFTTLLLYLLLYFRGLRKLLEWFENLGIKYRGKNH